MNKFEILECLYGIRKLAENLVEEILFVEAEIQLNDLEVEDEEDTDWFYAWRIIKIKLERSG